MAQSVAAEATVQLGWDCLGVPGMGKTTVLSALGTPCMSLAFNPLAGFAHSANPVCHVSALSSQNGMEGLCMYRSYFRARKAIGCPPNIQELLLLNDLFYNNHLGQQSL